MKTKFNGILTLLLAFIVQISFAQEKTISGTISDETGPLPGVSVMKKGTSTGTETDFDGNYTIKAKSGDILVFSFVGMKIEERTVGISNNITFMMESDNLLDEVVVVGYGTSTKESFVGTAKTVKAEALEVKNVSNISQALIGEVAGVTVLTNSGQPGSSARVRIRGFGSINGNQYPLYVVDGVPFDGNLNSINPADIASTTVLKDATATAIYGSRGANGVILITTKRGVNGASSIELDVKTGVNFQNLPRQDVIRDPDAYIGLSWEAMYNRGVASGEADPEAFANANLFGPSGIDTDYNFYDTDDVSQIVNPTTRTVNSGVGRKYTPENWSDYAFQASIRKEVNLRMSGGDEKTKYFSSFGYLDDIGYIINSSFERYSTRLNISHKPTKWLTAGANIGYTHSTTNNNGQTQDSGSIFWFVDNLPSIYPLFLRNPDGSIVEDTILGGNQYDYGDAGRGFGALTNSIADATYDISRTNRHEINTSFNFDIELSENLTFENKAGIQYFINRFESLNNPYYGSGASTGGSIFKRDTERVVQNYLQLLRYNNQFGNHGLELLAAHESNSYSNRANTASKNTAILPFNTDLSNFVNTSSNAQGYRNEATLESYFSQANYNYNNKYYFSASVRRDGSSRFVEDRWDTFGSVGASWIISKEDFFTSNFVNFLKLKASYGIVGEQSGVGFIPGNNTFLIDNLNGEISLSPFIQGNPDLTWETSKTFQTGLEFSLGKYIDGSVDYYSKDTENLLFEVRRGSSSGLATVLDNDGVLRNSGFEFDLTGHLVNTKDFKLDLTLNGATLNNKVVQMVLDPSTGEAKDIDSSNIPFAFSEGKSIYDYYLREWAGVDPADGRAMWLQNYYDANDNGIYDAGDELFENGIDMEAYKTANPDNTTFGSITTKTYADATQKYVDKSAIPTLTGAFRLGGTFKNFDFGAQFTYSLGGYGYDGQYATLMDNDQIGSGNWHTDIDGRWQQPGDITDIPRLSSGFDANVNSRSTRFLISSDYLALNNLKIGYTLPKDFLDKTSIQNVNIWVSGDNLFLLSARDGYNPTLDTLDEDAVGSIYTYAPLTTITLGVRVKF